MLTLWPQTSDSIVIDWSDGWGTKFSSCFFFVCLFFSPQETYLMEITFDLKKLKFVSDSSPGHTWVWQQNKRGVLGWGMTSASQLDIPPPTTVPCRHLSSWDSAGHAQLPTGLFTYMCTPPAPSPPWAPQHPQLLQISDLGDKWGWLDQELWGTQREGPVKVFLNQWLVMKEST